MKPSTMLFATLFLAASAQMAGAQTPVEPAKPVRQTLQPGKYNAITDVPGIEVGNFEQRSTGTTVVLAPNGAVGGVDVRGSAPGTRETDLLDPTNLVDKVDAVVLTGGSAYGLATAHGVMLWLEEKKRGWNVGRGNVVPIVPAAVLFDPGRFGRAFNDRPTEEFGRRAAEAASAGPVAMGNVGAGAGAVAGGLKGGLGTASVDLGNGVIVGAIVAVNAGGSTVRPRKLRKWRKMGSPVPFGLPTPCLTATQSSPWAPACWIWTPSSSRPPGDSRPPTSMPWAPRRLMPWPAPSCGQCSAQRLLAPRRLTGTVSPALLATDANGPRQHVNLTSRPYLSKR